MAEYLRFNSPIHNLQVFLRLIANKYSDIPSVIPDGVYGESTKNAVSAFQKKFMLTSTGIVDNSTWDKIIDVYTEIESKTSNSRLARIYPENGLCNDNKNYVPTIYIMQVMMTALSDRFSNISKPSLNGILDNATINSIKTLQVSSGLNPDVNVTKIFWDYLSVIYETFVSVDRVEGANIE